jgi:hypothetical protein
MISDNFRLSPLSMISDNFRLSPLSMISDKFRLSPLSMISDNFRLSQEIIQQKKKELRRYEFGYNTPHKE